MITLKVTGAILEGGLAPFLSNLLYGQFCLVSY